MKSAGKARNNGLYRHIRTSKEIIRNLLNDSFVNITVLLSKISDNIEIDVVIIENINGFKVMAFINQN